MAFAALTIDLNARLAKFEDDMSRVRKSMGGIEKSAGLLKAGLGGIFAGVGVAGLAAFAKNGIDAADALKDMSDRLGVSVKDLASFKLAAEQSGTSLDDVGKGIARLTRSIGQAEGGNKNLAKALTDLGITARDPKEAFFQLADATEKIQDPSKRAALLAQVLGKSYQDLIPLLNQGSAELRKSAQESESFADAMSRLAPEADKFNDNLALLKNNAAGAAANLLSSLVPALNELLRKFQQLRTLQSSAGFLSGFGTGFTGVLNEDLPKVNKEVKTLEERLQRIAKTGFGGDALKTVLTNKLEGYKKIQASLRAESMQGAMALAEQQYKKPPGSINTATENPKSTKTKAATDPLASLLSQTEIVKMQEFEKQVALLNARFDGGKKNADLYSQAMKILVETTFSNNFKKAAEDLEFMQMVQQDGIATVNESNERTRQWKESVSDAQTELINLISPVNTLIKQLTELDKFDGFIDPEVLAAARLEINAQIDELDKLPKKANEIKDPFKAAFEEMGAALSNFVTTGKLDFQGLVKSMLAGLAKIAFQKALAGLAGNAGSGGAGGWIGTIAKALTANAKGNVFNSAGLSAFSGSIVSKPTVFPFAKGIGLMGEAGPEAIMPLKRGKDGKLGVASTGGGGVIINVSVDATGSKVEGDQGKSGEFGRMIGNAVRGVLVQEMRPGGMLA